MFAQCLCLPADPGVGALQEPQQRDQPAAAPVQSSNELQQSQPGVEGGAGGWSAQEQAADLQHPKPTLIIHRPPHAPHAAPRDSDRADKPKTRTARRGPMDEMRQLVRILVKVGLQAKACQAVLWVHMHGRGSSLLGNCQPLSSVLYNTHFLRVGTCWPLCRSWCW